MANPVPTIADLAHKKCFICQASETDSDDINLWTHPCNCPTAVAHQSCLLKHISDLTHTKLTGFIPPGKEVRCPVCQCRYHFSLASSDPRRIHWVKGFTWMNEIVDWAAARGIKIAGLGLAAGASLGLVTLSTYYGEYAIEWFFGPSVASHLLRSEPSAWPPSVLGTLPLVLPKLLLCRLGVLRWWPIILPSWIAYPPPVSSPYFSKFLNISLEGTDKGWRGWPPSPAAFFGLVLPVTRIVYSTLIASLKAKILGPPPSFAARRRRRLQRRAPEGNGNGHDNDNRAQREEGDQQEPGFVQRLLDNLEGVERALVDMDDNEPDEANHPPQNEDRRNNGEDAVDDDENGSVGFYSMALYIGSTILIPPISALSGFVLFKSIGWTGWGQAFLGLHRRSFQPPAFWRTLDTLATSRSPPQRWILTAEEIGVTEALLRGLHHWWFGPEYWRCQGDMTWWRNAVGLGLLVVLRDLFDISHTYYRRREQKSRKVKSLDFQGISLGEEDLIPQPS